MFPCGGGKPKKKKKPTPSQLHFEAPLRSVATVFPSVYVAVLATRFGEPIARLLSEYSFNRTVTDGLGRAARNVKCG